jgi:hypothetical protein
MKIFLSWLLRWVLLPLVLIILHLWSFGALYFSPIQPEGLRTSLAYAYGIAIPLAILIFRSKKWAVILPLAGFLCVLTYEWQIQPKKDGRYQPLVEQTAYAEFRGDQLILHHIRNADYRTAEDYDVRWETRTYDLKKLKTLDVYTNYWGMEAIAHVYMSFGFENGGYLAVSIEFRPEIGESYGTFNGLFKQYEIIYIWADERDVTRLRTNYKKEDVFLYRTTLTPGQIRKLLTGMLERTNALRGKPEFYNTLTESCTNTIGDHIIKAKVFDLPFWKRRILTGGIERRLYDEGLLATGGESFNDLRRHSKINDRAIAAEKDPRFSEKIRTHRPFVV